MIADSGSFGAVQKEGNLKDMKENVCAAMFQLFYKTKGEQAVLIANTQHSELLLIKGNILLTLLKV